MSWLNSPLPKKVLTSGLYSVIILKQQRNTNLIY